MKGDIQIESLIVRVDQNYVLSICKAVCDIVLCSRANGGSLIGSHRIFVRGCRIGAESSS
jgi:hypothetical protein